MMNIVRMAWRNVWRNHRRSLVTIAAMTLALTVELLYAGLVTGMFVDMEDDVTEMDVGDIQVMSPDYLDRPSLYTTVADHEAIIERLSADGYAATPRLQGGGLAASGDLSSGVAFVGVDPVREMEFADFEIVVAGRNLLPGDTEVGVIGDELAKGIGASVGDWVTVMTTSLDGMLNAVDFE